MKKNFFKATFLLLITAIIWGGTFVLVKQTLAVLNPLQVVAYRFTLAFLFLFAFYHSTAVKDWKKTIIPGVYLGLILAIAYVTQTYGLSYSAPSTSAFITGLNVVLVAFFEALLFRKPMPFPSLLGVFAAAVGLLILTWTGGLQFRIGDLLTLVCAIFFALHIVVTGKFVGFHQVKALIIYQFGTVSLLVWTFLLLGSDQITLPSKAWPSLLYLGIFGTALGFFFQTLAQRLTTPVHTAIVLSTEPVFAAIFAVLFAYEDLTLRLTFGGLLILAGMILTSIEGNNHQPEKSRVTG